MASRTQVIGIFNRAIIRWSDAVSSGNFKQQGDYDSSTDSVTGGFDTNVEEVLKVSFKRSDVDGTNVMSGDYQIMLRVDDLPAELTSAATITYNGKNVVTRNVETDPVNATYTVHVRPS